MADVQNTMTATLRRLAAEFRPIVEKALYNEAHIIMADAKRRTPVDTGALRSSGTVLLMAGVEEPTVELAFGNSSVEYALYVHEDLDAHHPNGEAQFLANALKAAEPDLAARLAERIARTLPANP